MKLTSFSNLLLFSLIITILFALTMTLSCKKEDKKPEPTTTVTIYEVQYQTPGVDGSMVTASGIVMVPPTNWTESFPLISVQHGTIFDRNVAPSYGEKCGEAQAWYSEVVSNGYIVVMADYIGLGQAGITYHPYFHAQTEATSTRDMIRAARQLCTEKGVGINDKLFLAGYSQGGNVTAALQRLLERDYPQEFKITASAIMAAPFDLEMLWDFQVETPNPISSVVNGLMIRCYKEIYDIGDSYSDFLVEPYDSLIPQLMDFEHNEDSVTQALSSPPKDIFYSQFLDEVKAGTNIFAEKIRINEVYDWSPQAPTIIVYSQADEVIPFAMELMAYNHMKELGGNVDTISTGNTLNHMDGFPVAMIVAKEFFDTFK